MTALPAQAPEAAAWSAGLGYGVRGHWLFAVADGLSGYTAGHGDHADCVALAHTNDYPARSRKTDRTFMY